MKIVVLVICSFLLTSCSPDISFKEPEYFCSKTETYSHESFTEREQTIVKYFVGKNLSSLKAWSEARGYSIRITEKNGEQLAFTQDFVQCRINVRLAGDEIVGINLEGS